MLMQPLVQFSSTTGVEPAPVHVKRVPESRLQEGGKVPPQAAMSSLHVQSSTGGAHWSGPFASTIQPLAQFVPASGVAPVPEQEKSISGARLHSNGKEDPQAASPSLHVQSMFGGAQ